MLNEETYNKLIAMQLHGLAAAFNLHREVAEVGHLERLQQKTAVGVGIHAHSQPALGRYLRQFLAELALLRLRLGCLLLAGGTGRARGRHHRCGEDGCGNDRWRDHGREHGDGRG